MPKLLWTINAIQNLSPEDIAGMKENELERLVSQTRKQVERRIKNIEKRGLYSHAAERSEPEIANRKDPNQLKFNDPRVMTVNQMRAEMARHQTFLNAKSSTVKGIQEIEKQQDLRLFGPIKEGSKTPAYRMTRQQRERYWALYNEYESRHHSASFDSNRVQQLIREEQDNLGSEASFEDILNNAFIRMQLEEGPIYEDGHKVDEATFAATYKAGKHDLEYWRSQL